MGYLLKIVGYGLVFALLCSDFANAGLTEIQDLCKFDCNSSYLAIPLSGADVKWPPTFLQFCDFPCHSSQCSNGCSSFIPSDSFTATQSVASCTNSCTVPYANRTQAHDSCYQGCHNALSLVIKQVRELLSSVRVENVERPDSRTLIVHWEINNNLAQNFWARPFVSLLVQARAKHENSVWHVVASQTFQQSFEVTIQALHTLLKPATEYEVRLSATIGSETSLVSDSFTLTTAGDPFWVPTTRPLISKKLRVLSDQVVLCWDLPPVVVNSQVTAYLVTQSWRDSGKNFIVQKTVHSRCLSFSQLKTGITYLVSILAASSAGNGPAAEEYIQAQTPTVESGELIFANSTGVYKLANHKDFIVTRSPIQMFTTSSSTLTAIAPGFNGDFYVGTASGKVYRINSGTMTEVFHARSISVQNSPIVDLSFDFMNKLVYILFKNQVLVCNYASCSSIRQIYEFSPHFKPLQIEIDSFNGYLYWLSRNGVHKSPLSSAKYPETIQISGEIIYAAYANSIALDFYTSNLLISTTNGLVAYSLVTNGSVENYRRARLNSGTHENAKKLISNNQGKLFWIGDSCSTHTCLHSEEEIPDQQNQSGELLINLHDYFLDQSFGQLVDVAWISNNPKYAEVDPPSEIDCLFGKTNVNVNWKSPKRLMFQNPTEWRHFVYSSEIFVANTEVAVGRVDNCSDTTARFSNLLPGTSYQIRLRACWSGVCSNWTDTFGSTFEKNHESESGAIFFAEKDKEVYGMHLNGQLENKVSSVSANIPNFAKILCFDQDESTDDAFFCTEQGIFRSSLVGRPLISNGKIRHLAVVSKAAMLFVAETYSINSYRLTGTFHKQILCCAPNVSTVCPEILGIAADSDDDKLLYIIRAKDGFVELYSLDYNTEWRQRIGKIETFPEIRQLTVLGEKLVFLTTDGRIGISEKSLQNIAWFPKYSDRNPFFLVKPQSSLSKTNKLPKVSNINDVMDKSTGKLFLRWNHTKVIHGDHGSLFYNVTVSTGHASLRRQAFTALATMRQVQLPDWTKGAELTAHVTTVSAWDLSVASATIETPMDGVENLTLYFTPVKTAYNQSVLTELVWNENSNWRRKPYQYQVFCWKFDPGRQILKNAVLDGDKTELSLGYLKSGLHVSCEVYPKTSEKDHSGTVRHVDGKTNTKNPRVWLFALSNSELKVLEAGSGKIRSKLAGKFESVATMGNDVFLLSENNLFWTKLDKIQERSQMRRIVLPNHNQQKIYAMTADWVGRKLFMAVEDKNNRGFSQIWVYQMPNSMQETVTTSLYVSVKKVTNNLQMVFNPFRNTLYVTNSSHSLLSVRDETVTDLSSQISCLRSAGKLGSGIGAEFGVAESRSPYLIFATPRGLMQFDPISMHCKILLSSVGMQAGYGVNSASVERLAVGDKKTFLLDKSRRVFAFDKSAKHVRILRNLNDSLEIETHSPLFQSLPDIRCLSAATPEFKLQPMGRRDLEITIAYPSLSSSCAAVSQPMSTYTAFIIESTYKVQDFTKCAAACLIRTSNSRRIRISGLKSHTEYTVRVKATNMYSNSSLSFGKQVTTSYGHPTAPRNVQVLAVTPKKLLVLWLVPAHPGSPLADLDYQVYVTWAVRPTEHTQGVSPRRLIKCDVAPCHFFADVPYNSETYSVLVSVKHQDGTSEVKSDSVKVSTGGLPGTITAVEQTADSLIVRWNHWKPVGNLTSVMVQYREAGNSNGEWLSASSAPLNPLFGDKITIGNLKPQTAYNFRYNAEYSYSHVYGTVAFNGTQTYSSPDAEITFKTKAMPPAGPPKLRFAQDLHGFFLRWGKPRNNGGSEVMGYKIQYRTSSTAEWRTAVKYLDIDDNTEIVTWRPAARLQNVDKNHEFRVAALNSEGIGPYTSATYKDKSTGGNGVNKVAIITAVVVLLAILLVGAVLALLYFRKRKDKKVPPVHFNMESVTTIGPGTTAIDPASQIPEDRLKALPHVPRGCITISRMLGKGAFGEVFEGLAYNLPTVGAKSVRVAIKTLRQGSRDEDRIKFLKEAVMMKNFNHPNIVKLLGVCLDTEPQWIISELMEGGDLLSYLRSVRPNEVMPSQVSLRDLLSIISDVAKGCAYLEEHHHVHRDLAARNCLISSRTSDQKVVKIADFGLTRDIYEDDYYRVDGQGLLPVRWMAPESMIDGLFTARTDVWSFGVLLWEVMTLGHQPYPGRTNWDVLNYVRIGGRLQKPDNCPPEIYELMLECWAFRAEERTNFADLKGTIDRVKELPNLQSDDPFPPGLGSPGTGPGQTNFGFSSSIETPTTTHSDGQVQVFATQNSAHFQRNDSNAGQSRGSKRKVKGFRSLRKNKEKKPAPMPPSKESLEQPHLRPSSAASNSTSFRPDSGLSSGSEIYTTQSEGYEVPLFRGHSNTKRNEILHGPKATDYSRIQGKVNPGYESPEKDHSAGFVTIEDHSKTKEEPPYLSSFRPQPDTSPRYVPSPSSSFRDRPRGGEATTPRSSRLVRVPPPTVGTVPSQDESTVAAGSGSPKLQYADLGVQERRMRPENLSVEGRNGATSELRIDVEDNSRGTENMTFENSPTVASKPTNL